MSEKLNQISGNQQFFNGEHFESSGDILSALLGDDFDPTESLRPVIENAQIKDSDKDRCGGFVCFQESTVSEDQPHALVYCLMHPQTKRLCFKYIDFEFSGSPCVAEVKATYKWEDGFIGEVSFDNEDWPYPTNCLVSDFYAQENKLQIGQKVKIELAAFAFKALKMEPKEFVINKGPNYEILKKEFLEENPNKSEADFEAPRISTKGAVIVFPDNDTPFYKCVLPVLELTETIVLGQPTYKIKTIFITEGVDTEEDVLLTLYVPKRILKGTLAVGDDLNCHLRLYARMRSKDSDLN